jgi:hypothetical protein
MNGVCVYVLHVQHEKALVKQGFTRLEGVLPAQAIFLSACSIGGGIKDNPPSPVAVSNSSRVEGRESRLALLCGRRLRRIVE